MSVNIAARLNRFIDHSIADCNRQSLRFMLVMIPVVVIPHVHTLSSIAGVKSIDF